MNSAQVSTTKLSIGVEKEKSKVDLKEYLKKPQTFKRI
jgi:hypothetical protein